MNFYDQILIDYYKNPRNRGELISADIKTEEFNPSCGDKVQYFIRVKDNLISEISFIGFGCVISQATASILTETVKDKDLDYVLHMNNQDILNLIKIELGPTRLKCALLPLAALQKGIRSFKDSFVK